MSLSSLSLNFLICQRDGPTTQDAYKDEIRQRMEGRFRSFFDIPLNLDLPLASPLSRLSFSGPHQARSSMAFDQGHLFLVLAWGADTTETNICVSLGGSQANLRSRCRGYQCSYNAESSYPWWHREWQKPRTGNGPPPFPPLEKVREVVLDLKDLTYVA